VLRWRIGHMQVVAVRDARPPLHSRPPRPRPSLCVPHELRQIQYSTPFSTPQPEICARGSDEGDAVSERTQRASRGGERRCDASRSVRVSTPCSSPLVTQLASASSRYVPPRSASPCSASVSCSPHLDDVVYIRGRELCDDSSGVVLEHRRVDARRDRSAREYLRLYARYAADVGELVDVEAGEVRLRLAVGARPRRPDARAAGVERRARAVDRLVREAGVGRDARLRELIRALGRATVTRTGDASATEKRRGRGETDIEATEGTVSVSSLRARVALTPSMIGS
jgi:hypothetical protein